MRHVSNFCHFQFKIEYSYCYVNLISKLCICHLAEKQGSAERMFLIKDFGAHIQLGMYD